MQCVLSMFAVVLGGSLIGGCAIEGAAAETTRAADLTEAPVTAAASAYVLSVSSDEAGNRVTSPLGTLTCADSAFCQFPYLAGTAITVKPRVLSDTVNCVRWSHWEGACAGQSSTCSLVMNSDLTTHAVWAPIRGCVPR